MAIREAVDPAILARAAGIELDPERANGLRPLVASLLERLEHARRALPDDASPLPTTLRPPA